VKTLTTTLAILLLLVGSAVAQDINYDKPKYKAGDCFVVRAPNAIAAVKIKKVFSVTLGGQTGHYYDIEYNGEPVRLATLNIDIWEAKRIKCSEYAKVAKEIELENKLAEEAKESRYDLYLKASEEAIEENFASYAEAIKNQDRKCNQLSKEEIESCHENMKASMADLQLRFNKKLAELKSKYPSLRITARGYEIYVDSE